MDNIIFKNTSREIPAWLWCCNGILTACASGGLVVRQVEAGGEESLVFVT